MTRTEFTVLLSRLLTQMHLDGEQPIIDYVMRSKQEQARLFQAGDSKDDGVIKVSHHQMGLAADIYLEHNGSIEWDKAKAEKYHAMWTGWGGDPAIPWDEGHFQGSK